MAWTVSVSSRARKNLRDAPPDVLAWAMGVLSRLQIDPRIRGAEKLKGRGKSFRVRRGDFRLIYEVIDSEQKVIVSHIANRREAYRG
jgi:mRNA interferase RelE/StbE